MNRALAAMSNEALLQFFSQAVVSRSHVSTRVICGNITASDDARGVLAQVYGSHRDTERGVRVFARGFGGGMGGHCN